MKSLTLENLRFQNSDEMSDDTLLLIARDDLIKQGLYAENDIVRITLADDAAYAAVAFEGEITAVVLLPRSEADGRFRFRPVEEELAPFVCSAPREFLQLLSSPQNEAAAKWRLRCDPYCQLLT